MNWRNVRDKLFLVKGRDIASFFLLLPAALPALMIRKKSRKPIWLVLERSGEARDNGRAFFEYLMRYKRHEVTPFYAIRKDAADAVELKKYGRHVIEYGSFQHILYFLACRANISSVKNMGPNDLMGFVFRRLGLMNNKMFFLQHGITVNHPDWLDYSDTRFRMVLCGAKPEYNYVKSEFGYPEDHVAYAGGMCRYDALQHFMQKAACGDSFRRRKAEGHGTHSAQPDAFPIHSRRRQILILPSWRTWLKPGDPGMMKVEHTDSFGNTEYFRKWKEFLLSGELRSFAQSHRMRIVFYPHPTMQNYIRNFQKIENGNGRDRTIVIADADDWKLNELIAESDLLITDYSSVFFDFIYMKKPVIFYQFDRKKYRRFHYREGYFSYEKNPFAHTYETAEDVLKELERITDASFQVSEEYLAAHKRYFPVYDDKNCERTWEIIKNVSDEV